MALTAEQINSLLGQSRTKGIYLSRLNQFLESGDQGVCAHEEWPTDFGEKSDSTVKQGFTNAMNSKNAGDGAKNVRVINNEGKTYLINAGSPEGAGAGEEV